MKNIIKSLAAFTLLCSANVHAVLIDFNTEIPDENVLLNFNSSGLDWVYAGPVAPNEFGPGNIETPDYRSAEGWRFASAFEWSIRPDWTDFIIGNAIVAANGGHSDHTTYRFASEYWGNFSHVDLSDAAAGRLTNGLDIGMQIGVPETWYVRDSRNAQIPEPSSFALMGLSLLTLAGIRRRRN